MVNSCANSVQNLCHNLRKKCACLPTVVHKYSLQYVSKWVKVLHYTHLPHPYTTGLSTAFLRPTPLFEYYFYPVSTGPTINTTKEIN